MRSGPKLTEMVAAEADGLLVMPFTSSRFFEDHTLAAVEPGLEPSQLGLDPLEVVPELIVCVGRDDDELAAADAGCRALLGFYGSTPAYRPVLEAEGRGELQPVLTRPVARAGRWDDMAATHRRRAPGSDRGAGHPGSRWPRQVRRRYGEHCRPDRRVPAL